MMALFEKMVTLAALLFVGAFALPPLPPIPKDVTFSANDSSSSDSDSLFIFDENDKSVTIIPQERHHFSSTPSRCSQAAKGKTRLAGGESSCVQSENFPNKYPSGRRNIWWFFADDSACDLNLECDFINIAGCGRKCKKDFLQVLDGDKKRKKYCGTGTLSPVNVGNRLRLIFRSNKRINMRGFHCSVTAICEGSTTKLVTDKPLTTTAASRPAGTLNCECGVTNPNRVVGGTPTGRNEYPFTVALTSQTSNRPFCGGSIINTLNIVTAAHCVYDTKPGSIRVLLGLYNWKTEANKAIARNVKAIRIHSGYNDDTLLNDIAILELSVPVTLVTNDAIKPICLPDINENFARKTGTVTGWGRLESGGDQPAQQYEVQLPIHTDTTCRNLYKGYGYASTMMCAGPLSGAKDSCNGDSGGPLSVKENGRHTLAGIVSWGAGCARENYPGVYTEASAYVAWIKNNAKTGKYCGN